MKFLSEKIVTVVTAGTPVRLVADGHCKKVVLYNNYAESTSSVFAVGKSATVDANSTPPVGAVIAGMESVSIEVDGDPENIYVDSNVVTNGSATVHYFGD
ncbi:MAG: hypothetical protein IMZ53_12990 [Thermoplasmata archaeon]|nr:hypothetical protein [Thermoplasmata archaeon]